MRIQLAKEARQFPVGKTVTSALEIAKSGANLVSDRKFGFSRNLGCALADFYGHYSSRDLHVLGRDV